MATVAELTEALSIIVTKVCEDVEAESAGIFVPDENDQSYLRGAACTGYFPILTVNQQAPSPKVRVNARYRMAYFYSEVIGPGEGLVGHVAVTRQPALYNRLESGSEEWSLPPEVKTMMVMPLLAEDRFVGVICAVNRRRAISPFSQQNLEFFQQFSSQPALACSLIAIYAERRRQDRLNRELEVCAELQKSMLPDIPPVIGEYQFATLHRPAYEVSGDFYDFIVVDATASWSWSRMLPERPACLLDDVNVAVLCQSWSNYTDMKSFLLTSIGWFMPIATAPIFDGQPAAD